jgi:hypothetical protein
MRGKALEQATNRRGIALAALVLALGACAPDAPRQGARPDALQAVSTDGVARFASGPILTACSRQPRTAATRARCGCVQAAADLTLTAQEQRRATQYFNNPDSLQEMKLSDSPANERLWSRWARFAETAEALCHGI